MRFAHVDFQSHPLSLWPLKGPTRCFLLRRAARARRAPAKRRMGLAPHTPHFAREACRRRNPQQTSSPKSSRYPARRRSLKAAGVRSPAVCFASIRRTCGTSFHVLGSPEFHRHAVCSGLRGNVPMAVTITSRDERRAGHACSHKGQRRPTCSQPRHALCSRAPAPSPLRQCDISTSAPLFAYPHQHMSMRKNRHRKRRSLRKLTPEDRQKNARCCPSIVPSP